MPKQALLLLIGLAVVCAMPRTNEDVYVEDTPDEFSSMSGSRRDDECSNGKLHAEFEFDAIKANVEVTQSPSDLLKMEANWEATFEVGDISDICPDPSTLNWHVHQDPVSGTPSSNIAKNRAQIEHFNIQNAKIENFNIQNAEITSFGSTTPASPSPCEDRYRQKSKWRCEEDPRFEQRAECTFYRGFPVNPDKPLWNAHKRGNGEKCNKWHCNRVCAGPRTVPNTVTGPVSVSTTEAGALELKWDLQGLEQGESGGIHVHYGTSCDDEATVKGAAPANANKGHYYVPASATALDPSEDPWSTVTWSSDADGKAASSAVISPADLNADADTAYDRVVIVHNSAKEKVGCGLLKSYSPENVMGDVSVSTTEDGELELKWKLTGLEKGKSGGIHVHYGTSCQSETTVKGDAPANANKGHYYNATSAVTSLDPWSNVKWSSDDDGIAAASVKISSAKLNAAAGTAYDRVVIVHNEAGKKVGCGLLVSYAPKNVMGEVIASTTAAGDLLLKWDLQGLEQDKSGGIHVHYGTSCESETTVKGLAPDNASKGHYYVNTSDVPEDPWSAVKWRSDDNGIATDSVVISSADLNVTADTAFNRVVIVHNSAGKKVGCGLLTLSAPGCGSGVTGGHYDPTFACGPASQNNANGICDFLRESGQTEKYTTSCGNNKQLCEIGDQSGKMGPLDSTSRSTQAFTDTSMEDIGRLKGRSLVLHCGKPRIACANLETPTPPTGCTDSTLTDGSAWKTHKLQTGKEYHCADFADSINRGEPWCGPIDEHDWGDQFEIDGKTANQACCACGGGE